MSILAAAGIAPSKTTYNQVSRAIRSLQGVRTLLADTGSANAYAAANPVPMAVLPASAGVVQMIEIAHTNTGASTYAPDGLAAAPIFGLSGQALSGGELVANGVATLMSFVSPLLNAGALCWILLDCVGGKFTGAIPGQLLNVQRFTANGTYTPTPGTSKIIIEMVGGGAGSNSLAAPGSGNYSLSAGGGSGAYAKFQMTGGFSGGIPVTIGGGGGIGSNGGTTSFGSVMSCGGGIAAAPLSALSHASYPTAITAEASAGSASALSSGTLLSISGGQGTPGISTNNGILGGAGGSNPLGNGGASLGAAANAVQGQGFGAGAGGCCTDASASNVAVAGAGGLPGVLIVYEYA